MNIESITEWLKVCRFDVAHLTGEAPADGDAWARANAADALERFNASLQDPAQHAGDPEFRGLDIEEGAFLAVKMWAQGAFYRPVAPAGI